MRLEEFKRLVPKDFAFHSKRDASRYLASVLSFSYVSTFEKIWHIKFSAVFWVVRDKNKFSFYDSPSEHKVFDKTLGEKAKDIEFAKLISKKLIEYSDQLTNFICNHSKEEFLDKIGWFSRIYQEWFAYHQAVAYSSNYLSDNFPECKENIDIMHKAYAFNEMVAQKVEEFVFNNNVDKINYYTQKEVEGDVGFLCLPDKQILIQGKELDEIQEYLDNKTDLDIKEIKGKVAFDKTVTGEVQVIPDFDGLVNVKEGVILVTHLTQPKFNIYCRKAKGIVTDYGGLSSHSAILAREAKIPCIVGTKVATKILKNGDMVEMDTKTGVVKKIS
ncbi:MAG: PEP-utilizing enzyme [Candidatus Woesearchaeota archaeon]